MPISSAAATERAAIAVIVRDIKAGRRPPNDPELARHRRALKDVLLAERVEAVVRDWPKLSEGQQARIAALFSTARAA